MAGAAEGNLILVIASAAEIKRLLDKSGGIRIVATKWDFSGSANVSNPVDRPSRLGIGREITEDLDAGL
jgi:hypothetical protein